MLNATRFSNTFFNRIYDCPQYTVVARRNRQYVRLKTIIRLILAFIGIVLLGTLAVIGGLKACIIRIRHGVGLLYMLSPVFAVVVLTLAEDALKFGKGAG